MLSVDTLALLTSAAAWAMVAILAALLVAYDFRRRPTERELQLTPEELADLEALEAAIEAARSCPHDPRRSL